MLYNIGIGARHDQLPLVLYVRILLATFIFAIWMDTTDAMNSEGDPNFQVLPTFGSTLNYFTNTIDLLPDLVPNFDPTKMLHGEQYLEIRQFPIPTAATLVSQTKVLEVIDKGGAAVVKMAVLSIDKATKREVFYNEVASFLRGSGGFGGTRKAIDRGASTAANDPPARKPDRVKEETIPIGQAAIYRLSGDYKYVCVFIPLSDP